MSVLARSAVAKQIRRVLWLLEQRWRCFRLSTERSVSTHSAHDSLQFGQCAQGRLSPSINMPLGLSFYSFRGSESSLRVIASRSRSLTFSQQKTNRNITKKPKNKETETIKNFRNETRLNFSNSPSLRLSGFSYSDRYGYSIPLLSSGGRQSPHGSVRHTQSG